MSRSDTIKYDNDSQMVTVSTLPVVNDENSYKIEDLYQNAR